ncbi:MAG: MFS transporter [Burkholderiales bacterium RIFCSPHIGHO2_12_FULL_69_20]|nr:MAG: MFS transporter [Burkholderiales bacterium RIFCSPHIGHO2_12_FULL_69_20]
MTADTGAASRARVLRQALALSLGAAVSLGLARFSYALLLGPMRADLGWSYFTAGAMNTGNAAGYLLGALVMPRLMAKVGPKAALVGGGLATALLLMLHGMVTDNGALMALRLASGAASAATFVAGGLLAARLGGQAVAAAPGSGLGAGLVLGLYYGGTGLGIIVSAFLVPAFDRVGAAHGWQPAWQALGAVALGLTVLMALGTARDAPVAGTAATQAPVPWRALGWALAGYAMFGLGYIGYMTFIVTLLREQQLGSTAITAFYVTLGLGVVASSWLWAGLLQRWRGGQVLALLNGLLALATVLPVLSPHPLAVFGSGALFGAVFLSVVASTTALVRHNLPVAAWPRGIAAFTILFALGQIAGPSLVGLIADGPGGLARGLALSAAMLALGAVLALAQRPLRRS